MRQCERCGSRMPPSRLPSATATCLFVALATASPTGSLAVVQVGVLLGVLMSLGAVSLAGFMVGSMSDLVSKILRVGSVRQIAQHVVVMSPIKVPNLHAFGTRSNECPEHDSVDVSRGFPGPVMEGDLHVTTLIGTNVLKASRPMADPPSVRHLVNPFPSDYGSPAFVLLRGAQMSLRGVA